MASNTTPWATQFSDNPTGRPRRGRDLNALLRAISRERVRHPAEPAQESGPALTRLEILARVLWTRATVDGDMTAIKLLLECLLARPDAVATLQWTADDYAAAQALLNEALAKEEARHAPTP